MLLRYAVVPALALATSVRAQQPQTVPSSILTLEDTAIVFADGRTWVPQILQVQYHGALSGGVYVISGHECTACDAAQRLHVLPMGASARDTTFPQFYYPGTVRGEEGPGPFVRSRAFVGVCTPAPDTVLSIATSVVTGDDKWSDSGYVVRGRLGRPSVHRIPGRAGIERQAEQRVKQGVCHEIPAVNGQFEG